MSEEEFRKPKEWETAINRVNGLVFHLGRINRDENRRKFLAVRKERDARRKMEYNGLAKEITKRTAAYNETDFVVKERAAYQEFCNEMRNNSMIEIDIGHYLLRTNNLITLINKTDENAHLADIRRKITELRDEIRARMESEETDLACREKHVRYLERMERYEDARKVRNIIEMIRV